MTSAGEQCCTLADYADATNLPTEFLARLGVSEARRKRGTVVTVTYRDEAGRDQGTTRCLTPPTGVQATNWDRPGELGLYGLEQLRDARDELFVVADEVEAQTLQFHGIAALAVTDSAWRGAWPSALDEVSTIYVVVPDLERGTPIWLDDAPFKEEVRVVALAGDLPINRLHRAAPICSRHADLSPRTLPCSTRSPRRSGTRATRAMSAPRSSSTSSPPPGCSPSRSRPSSRAFRPPARASWLSASWSSSRTRRTISRRESPSASIALT